MLKYRVIGDLSSNPWHSSRIIIDALNKGARKIGVYDDAGVQVNYSVLCESFGLPTDAYISVFELSYPHLILQNAGGKPLLGVSRDNLSFILDGGYDPNRCSWFPLGVDTNIWRKVPRTEYFDKTVVLVAGDSNVRSCYPEAIQAFGECFKGRKDILLYLRDRNATDLFKNYVKERAAFHDIEIVHNDTHLENFEEQVQIFSNADIHLHINKSSTWNLCLIQGLACEIATIGLEYSGSREYLQSGLNSYCPHFSLNYITQMDLSELEFVGMRNYFFPINTQNYPSLPFWAIPDPIEMKYMLTMLTEHKEIRNTIAHRGMLSARGFSWEKSALLLSFELEKLLR